MKYEWLLFDLDNTILDFNGASIIAFQETLIAFNMLSQSNYYDIYKKMNKIVWTAYENKEISSTDLRAKRFELFLNEINCKEDPSKMNATYLSLLVKHSELLLGTKEILEELSLNYKMVIITNGLKEVQRPRIALTEIDSYFYTIIVSDEIGVAKPQTAYFDYTLNQINNPPKSSILVIGDGLNSDIKGGINYGLDTCWFNPDNKFNVSGLEPTYEITSLTQLKILEII